MKVTAANPTQIFDLDGECATEVVQQETDTQLLEV